MIEGSNPGEKAAREFRNSLQHERKAEHMAVADLPPERSSYNRENAYDGMTTPEWLEHIREKEYIHGFLNKAKNDKVSDAKRMKGGLAELNNPARVQSTKSRRIAELIGDVSSLNGQEYASSAASTPELSDMRPSEGPSTTSENWAAMGAQALRERDRPVERRSGNAVGDGKDAFR